MGEDEPEQRRPDEPAACWRDAAEMCRQVEMEVDLEMCRGEGRGVVRQKLAHRFADDLRVAL